jgi:hypothetical protein
MATLPELRDALRAKQEAAKAAGLTPVLAQVDLKLALAVTESIALLDAALAAHTAAVTPDLRTQHAAIVESLDADAPPARTPLAPLMRPLMPPPGSVPITTRQPPPPRPMPPKMPRKPTGPDEFDKDIPF